MKLRIVLIAAIVTATVAWNVFSDQHDADKKPDVLAGTIEGLSMDNLLTSRLEMADGLEVVVSHVVVPPNTALPKHWHPGEEFAYVIDGSLTFWQDGEEEVLLKAGDVGKVPLKKVHNIRTTDSAATLLVFRVHESGQPVRVLVD